MLKKLKTVSNSGFRFITKILFIVVFTQNSVTLRVLLRQWGLFQTEMEKDSYVFTEAIMLHGNEGKTTITQNK